MKSNILNLNVKQGLSTLAAWAKPHIRSTDSLVFSKACAIGGGNTEHNVSDGTLKLSVGIGNLIDNVSDLISDDIDFPELDDEYFVAIGIATFHEIAHYNHIISDDLPKEQQLSELSSYGNHIYYRLNWHTLPHEIEAEYLGIKSMWGQLEQMAPDDADDLMFRHLKWCSNNMEYPISCPEKELCTKEYVGKLFDEAYEKSLVTNRSLPDDFIRCGDQIGKMLSDDGNIIIREYVPIHNKLIVSCTDEKMASLVSYIHPELQTIYSIDFTSLNPKTVFGYDIKETPEEINNRIVENEFADSVSEMSEEHNNGISK